MKSYLFYLLLLGGTVGLNFIGQKLRRERWNLWLGYGLPGLIMVTFLWAITEPHSPYLFTDFNKAYYPAGHVILQDTSGLYAKSIWGDQGFVNIPIIAVIFTPFSFLSLNQASFLFTALGILSILVSGYLLQNLTQVKGEKVILLIALLVINGPLYYSVLFGNTTHFLLLLLVTALLCLQKKLEIFSGILLAISALIKIPLLLLVVYFALRKRWQVLIGFTTAILLVVGASLLFFGVDLHFIWYRECILPYLGKPIGAYNVQSVDGFVARLLTKGNLSNWVPLELGLEFILIRFALLSLLIGITTFVCWRSKSPETSEEENLEFSIVLCLMLLISPISWTHYYLFLILPFSLYLGNKLAIPEGRLWFIAMMLSILLTSLPVIIKSPTNPIINLLYFKLFISHYFFGGVLLLGVLLTARWHASRQSRLTNPTHEIQEKARLYKITNL
jgi:hypothetical protein